MISCRQKHSLAVAAKGSGGVKSQRQRLRGCGLRVTQHVAGITAGMFDQILLMVILGGIEFTCGGYVRGNWPAELAGFVPKRFHSFGGLLLDLAGVKNSRPILRSHIIMLPVQCGG